MERIRSKKKSSSKGISNKNKTRIVQARSSKKTAKVTPFIGTTRKHLSRSPWDFYSLGHIDVGIVSFLLLSLAFSRLNVMFFVLVIGVAWELFENVIIYGLGAKPGNRRDSLVNSAWDIALECVGGSAMWFFKWLIVDSWKCQVQWFYAIGAISFGTVLSCFFVGFFVTSRKKKR